MRRGLEPVGEGHPRLFDFERDLYPSMHCIPMVVRHQLDLIGIKVPLKAWNALPLAQRLDLLDHGPVATEAELAELRVRVEAWLRAVSDEPLRPVVLEELPSWQDLDHLDPDVADQTARCHPPFTVEEWATFELLERFALVKLSRSKHERGRVPQAVAEFRHALQARCAAGGSRNPLEEGHVREPLEGSDPRSK